jgi:hypothetical protein
MRTVSSKVDNTIHDQILNRCNGIGCSPSQYIKDLIAKDLRDGGQAPSASNGAREVVQGKWKDAPAKTVIIDESQTEIDKGNGVTDVYKDGNLAYTKIPPRLPGGQWTYRLYS